MMSYWNGRGSWASWLLSRQEAYLIERRDLQAEPHKKAPPRVEIMLLPIKECQRLQPSQKLGGNHKIHSLSESSQGISLVSTRVQIFTSRTVPQRTLALKSFIFRLKSFIFRKWHEKLYIFMGYYVMFSWIFISLYWKLYLVVFYWEIHIQLTLLPTTYMRQDLRTSYSF